MLDFKITDIDIFIATYNRSNLLEESLLSVLNQSIKPDRITVLDNESTDNTADMLKKYQGRNVYHVITTGKHANFNYAKKASSRPYVMIFHDDDLLNIHYLENILHVLNKEQNVSLITAWNTMFKVNKEVNLKKKLSKAYHLFPTGKDFASFMYFLRNISYSAAVYNTKYFKSHDYQSEIFGKHADWPFLIDIANCGNSILLEDKNSFFARVHNNQDQLNISTRPSVKEIIDHDRKFYNIMQLDQSTDLSLINAYRSNAFSYIIDRYNYNYRRTEKNNLKNLPSDIQKYFYDLGIVVISKKSFNRSNIGKQMYKLRYKYLAVNKYRKLFLAYLYTVYFLFINRIFFIRYKEKRIYYRLFFIKGYLKINI